MFRYGAVPFGPPAAIVMSGRFEPALGGQMAPRPGRGSGPQLATVAIPAIFMFESGEDRIAAEAWPIAGR